MRYVKKQKAVFWDRDGVLNDVLFEADGYRRSPRLLSELKLREGARETLAETKKRGYLNILVTSQPEVKRGLVSREELEKIHNEMKASLALADVFICFHDNEDNCDCRKPKPGLILEAARKWDIDVAKSFMIGDTDKDVGAGKQAGCRTVLVDAFYNREVKSDFRIASLSDLITLLGTLRNA